MKIESDIDTMIAIAKRQEERSAARDYWQGIHDVLCYLRGDDNSMTLAIGVWMAPVKIERS